MKYGEELIKELEAGIARDREAIRNRIDRINEGLTDMDDCFISQRCDERGISLAMDKISLLKRGGCEWFVEYATLDGVLVHSFEFENKYGRYTKGFKMPDGTTVFTSADTAKGLAKKGIKRVLCLRPAWFCFRSSQGGMLGVYTGSYVTFPSDVNYATGEPAGDDPIEMKDFEEVAR